MMSNTSLSFQMRRQSYLQRCLLTSASAAAAPENDETAMLAGQLRQILVERQLTTLFQPIVDLAHGRVAGFEGLIRGPSGSPLHSPLQLFSAAEATGMREPIEHLSRQVTIGSFHRLDLPGRLFLNVSPECLLQPTTRAGRTLTYIRELGVDPSRVVIELTENQPTFDFDLMRDAVRHYRDMGFSIAIDDLGQGFSSLRLWSELRPEFVKIDRHFVQGVDGDSVKRQFLESLQEIALRSGCSVIAEGIETEGEMAAVAATGIALGQGYWFARPQAIPATRLDDAAAGALRSHGEIRRGGGMACCGRKGPRAADMILPVPVVERTATTEAAFVMFEKHPELQSLPVLDAGRPVGLISRLSLIDRYARPYRRELYGKKPCTLVMDAQPLHVEGDTSLQQLGFLLADGDRRHLANGFLIVEDGRYLGWGSGHSVVREITRLQIEAARHTNPLTGLPGNLPINEAIGAWLGEKEEFHACYCDIDHFKPFNDVYGYSRGDDMIRALADVLRANCAAERDFIGHIGGDDFMVLFAGADWEERCQRIFADFTTAVDGMFSAADRERGGYVAENRQGQSVFVPLATLSLGAVHVETAHFSAFHQVSAAAAIAKKEAKKLPGNSLFVERRHGGEDTPAPSV